MRNMNGALVGTAAALVLLAGCNREEKQERAQAADARAAGFTPPSVTSRMDYGGMTERRFRSIDRNNDDVIEANELPRQDSRIVQLDRNKDGEVTSSEWSEGLLARFDTMDLNKDGTVTSEERQTAEKQGLVPPSGNGG